MKFYSLVYTSVASQNMTDDALKMILKQSRKNNEKLEITGMLLYRDGLFIQALEGEQNTVEELFATILKDERHHHVTLIYKNYIRYRRFPDWSMGFNRIDDTIMEFDKTENSSEENLVGYIDYFSNYANEVDVILDKFSRN